MFCLFQYKLNNQWSLFFLRYSWPYTYWKYDVQVNIKLPGDGNFDCVVFVDIEYGAVVLMMLVSLDNKLFWSNK